MTAKTTVISSTTPVMLETSAHSTVVSVVNLDAANSVYLSADAVGVATAIELTAGSSIPWDIGNALYAFVLDSTKPISLLTYDNSGMFSNGVAVANALTKQGLTADNIALAIENSGLTPAQIATQIQTSGLTPLQIATQIQNKGVPAIDIPTILINNAPISNAWDSTTYLGTNLICGPYQSLAIDVSQATGDTACRNISVVFFDNNANILHRSEFLTSGLQSGGVYYSTVNITIPAVGYQCIINVDNTGVAFTGNLSVTGSYRNVLSEEYAVGGNLSLNVPATNAALGNGLVYTSHDFYSWKGTNAGTFGPVIVPMIMSRNGSVHMLAANENGTGTLTVGALDRYTNTWLTTPTAVAGGATRDATFTVKNRPWDLYIGGSSLVGIARLNFTTS